MGSRDNGRQTTDDGSHRARPREWGRGPWFVVWGLFLLVLAPPAAAQIPDSLATPPPTPLVVVDTTEATPDTSRTPVRALRRALILPGWGQLYNREPAKVPFVVVGMVGTGAFAVYQHDRYLLFRHAFLYRQQEDREERDGTPNEFERFEEEWIEAGRRPTSTLRTLRQSARSNRDIAVLLTGLVYALQALDAYVAAELDGFDVSEDLSLQVVPTADGPALTLRLGL